MRGESEYLNFPIELIKGGIKNISETCLNITYYCFYASLFKLEGAGLEKAEQIAAELDLLSENDLDGVIEEAEGVYNNVENHRIITGIKKVMVLEFKNQPKTEIETAVFLTFCAMKSILGKKGYVRLSNNFLIARMAGFREVSYLDEGVPSDLLPWTSRRKLDQIKEELRLNWGIKIYGKVYGYFITIDLKLEDLIYIVENGKMERKLRLKQEQREAEERALERLKRDLQCTKDVQH